MDETQRLIMHDRQKQTRGEENGTGCVGACSARDRALSMRLEFMERLVQKLSPELLVNVQIVVEDLFNMDYPEFEVRVLFRRKWRPDITAFIRVRATEYMDATDKNQFVEYMARQIATMLGEALFYVE
jgi:hypothetical protein